MTRRMLATGLLFLTLMASSGLAADDKGIKVVPREQVQKERAKRWAVLIGVDKYEDEKGIGVQTQFIAEGDLAAADRIVASIADIFDEEISGNDQIPRKMC